MSACVRGRSPVALKCYRFSSPNISTYASNVAACKNGTIQTGQEALHEAVQQRGTLEIPPPPHAHDKPFRLNHQWQSTAQT